MIRIKSKRHNFRRCGMAHPAETVEYPDDKFTAVELVVLKAEPMLIVEVIPSKAAAGDGIEEMTVEKLREAIMVYGPDRQLKGLKKAELAEMLKECQRNFAAPKE